jgi:hypothetical protein
MKIFFRSQPMVNIPNEFGYVMLVLGLSWFMNFYLASW